MKLPHYTERDYEAARQRRRYQTDPAYRLDRVNRSRQRRGVPLAQSPDEIGRQGQRIR
jgi:hypothetical protein